MPAAEYNRFFRKNGTFPLWVGRDGGWNLDLGPMAVPVALQGAEAAFVAHFLAAGDPVAEVQPVVSELPGQLDLLQDRERAQTALRQRGVKKGIDRRQGIVQLVGDGRHDDALKELDKAVEPAGPVGPGDVLTYTLTFTNAGPATSFGNVHA